MRRPRSKLEVSTFPFLAVLLCAMGALLLLLFIMDRRAKIAAQYSVSEAVAERKKRSREEDDARQAEWQKAKDLLHQSLLAQQDQLLADGKGLQQDLDDASKKLAIVQTQHVDLQGKVQGEAAQIALLNTHIASQRAGLSEAEKKDVKSKTELLEAARELAELERAFQQLRALREKDKQVYSVVPYHGKRGDLRTPIYVECVPAGVLFHPEKKLLERWDFTPESLRREVERRSGPLAMEKSIKEKSRAPEEERNGPYVLFLVRPEGIANYYKAQASLKGYQLDFGYELVDADWVLDFTSAPGAKPTPPVTFAKAGGVRKSEAAPLGLANSGSGAGQGVSPSPPPGNVGTGTLGGGLPPLTIPPPNAGRGPGGVPGSNGPPPITGIGPGGIPGSNGPAPITGIGPGGIPGSNGPAPITGIGPGGIPGSNGPAPITGIGPGGIPGSNGPAPITGIGPGGIPGSNGPAPITGIGPGGIPGSNGPAPITGIGPGGIPGSNGPPMLIPPPIGGIGTGGAPSAPQTGNPSYTRVDTGIPSRGPAFVPISRVPQPVPIASSGSAPSTGLQGSPTPGGGSPGLAPINLPVPGNNVGGKPGGASSPPDASPADTPRDPYARSAPIFGAEPVKKPAPSPVLSKLLGNRDFVITIDCYSDHVTVLPSGLQYRWTGANDQATDKAVTQTVTNLIARRQASVRPGEPPYRPLIHFQVAADGLRSYLRVYPLLEPLHVPMTRENVED